MVLLGLPRLPPPQLKFGAAAPDNEYKYNEYKSESHSHLNTIVPQGRFGIE